MLGLIRRQHPLEIQANEMANHLQAKLSRMGMEHRRSVAGADYEERQVVSFRSIEASPEFVKIRLDVDSLPRGVTTAKIRDPDVLDDLGYALGYRVSFEARDRQQGCWFVIHLRDNDGLPRLVPFAQMLQSFPARPAPLMIPLGVAADGVRWANLREFPHLLMAGATGKGKSNEVHAMLLSLLRLPPDDLQLVLVDLKGGITLGQYKNVPHTSRTVYIRKADKLPQMLLGLQTEMERRTDLMERYGVEDIEEYNKLVRARERKRYIVVVIEEIANAMLVKTSIKMPDNERSETIAVATERLLADIAGRSRAEGIHMICTTQHPDSTVLTGLIRANFPVRIAFGTSSKTASRVILDDSGARGLIPGRFLMLYNADYTYMQAPLIEDAERRSIIRRIQHNERWLRPQSSLARRNRDLLLLLEVVARDFGGVIRMHDDELRRMCRQPDLKSARITPGKIREYAGILHADQLVKRGWGGDYKIATCRKTWKVKYPVDEAVLSDTDASEPVCEDDIIEGEVVDAGTGTEPAIRLLEPPDPRADEIRRWADSGHSRNQMARMLRMNKAEALKLIERVLGPAEAQQKNLEVK
jgi:DNA segregation ATPase FtsK/SpoIIIE-like protein